MKRICVIAAHPDDIEISIYGTLCKYLQMGWDVNTVVVTDGELQGANRIDESKKALQKFKNFYLNQHDGNVIEGNIPSIIHNINPDLVITHSINDYHIDHVKVSEIVKKACSFKYPIAYMDTIMGVNSNPFFYFDITDFAEEKEKAIMCHHSQSPERLVYMSMIQSEFRAAQCGYKNRHAECLYYNQTFPYSDIRDLLPKPMQTLSNRKMFFS